jgi:hypothetical protein
VSNTDFNFKPITCRDCGNLVWDGLSATSACPVKLDTARLNILDEVGKLRNGIGTYQIHRTTISFEATRRTPIRMFAVDPIVLATHTCRTMVAFGEVAPEYFNRPKVLTTSEEVPF